MFINVLVGKYPKIYHMADKRNWDNICEHGLLSTTALLDLFEYTGDERFEIESQLRLSEFKISHPDYGEAIIRDQDPMKDRPSKGQFLERCLDGITPQQWFEFLNRRTFFWADRVGLNRLLGAVEYRQRSHYVITVDAQRLIDRHADRVTLSPINSGSLYGMKRRSTDTFKCMRDYRTPWVNELAVDYSVPDILDLAISVDECISQWDSGRRERVCRTIERIWPT